MDDAENLSRQWKLCKRCSYAAPLEHRFCSRCGNDTWIDAPTNFSLPQAPLPGNPPSRIVVPWTAGDVAKGVGLFLLMALSSSILLELIAPQNGNGDGEIGPYVLAAAAMAQVAFLMSVWLFAVSKYQIRWRSLGFSRRPGRKEVLFAIAAFIGAMAVQVIYFSILDAVGVDTESAIDSIFDEESMAVLVMLSILALVVAPVAEEVFYRGFVFGGLTRRFGFRWGVVGSGALFSLSHVEPITLFPLLVLGILLAWVYYRTESLWTPVMVHFFNNSVAVAVQLA